MPDDPKTLEAWNTTRNMDPITKLVGIEIARLGGVPRRMDDLMDALDLGPDEYHLAEIQFRTLGLGFARDDYLQFLEGSEWPKMLEREVGIQGAALKKTQEQNRALKRDLARLAVELEGARTLAATTPGGVMRLRETMANQIEVFAMQMSKLAAKMSAEGFTVRECMETTLNHMRDGLKRELLAMKAPEPPAGPPAATRIDASPTPPAASESGRPSAVTDGPKVAKASAPKKKRKKRAKKAKAAKAAPKTPITEAPR